MTFINYCKQRKKNKSIKFKINKQQTISYLVLYDDFDLRSYIFDYVCLDDFIDSIEKNIYFSLTDNKSLRLGEVYKILNEITKLYTNYEHPLSTLLIPDDLIKLKKHINTIIDYILSNNAFELLNDYDVVSAILHNDKF